MTIEQIFKLGIEMGIKSDFRSKKEIDEHLRRKKEEYEKLSKDEKEFFDKELIDNPYADSRIHNSNGPKKN